MRSRRFAWRAERRALVRGMAALLATSMVLQLAPAVASPGDIFQSAAPVLQSSRRNS